jgi:hypothetical protein
MRALSASELLEIWERGLTQQPIQRAIMLLAAACPEAAPNVLEELTIGERDAKLLTLREWTFGPQLVSLTTCPSCGNRLELTFNVADIRRASSSRLPLDQKGNEDRDAAQALVIAGYEVSLRLPNSLDLAAVAEREEVGEMRRLLLRRCLLTIHHNGEEVSAEELPPEVVEAVMKQMAQAEPLADVHLSLVCTTCKHQWQALFDIVTFFWTEIDSWAHRVLREVHTLASAYGWREGDILTMSPWRRQFYLTMVSG